MTKKLNLFNNEEYNREIPEEVKEVILSILNETNSDMVAIYGSYGTPKQHKDSDIDIAWLPKNTVSFMECNKVGNQIAKTLENIGYDLEVDLKTLGDIYPVCIEEEMMAGDVLFSTFRYGVFLANYDALNYPMLFVTHKGDWYYD